MNSEFKKPNADGSECSMLNHNLVNFPFISFWKTYLWVFRLFYSQLLGSTVIIPALEFLLLLWDMIDFYTPCFDVKHFETLFLISQIRLSYL